MWLLMQHYLNLILAWALELIYLLLLPFAVADTLLWKDKRQTLIALLVLIAIYYNFIASQSTIITALSKLLLVASIFLFIHGNLPEKMYSHILISPIIMPICCLPWKYKLSLLRIQYWYVTLSSQWADYIVWGAGTCYAHASCCSLSFFENIYFHYQRI